MDLSIYFREFRDAIVKAFRREHDFNELLVLDFSTQLDNLAGQAPYPIRVLEAIDQMDANGQVDQLFAAALKRRPGNPQLRELAAKIFDKAKSEQTAIIEGLTAKGIVSNIESLFNNPQADEIRATFRSYQSARGLEVVSALANAEAGDRGLHANLVSALQVAPNSICSIEIAGAHRGTGFLIGDSRVMTCNHVAFGASMSRALASIIHKSPGEVGQFGSESLKEDYEASRERLDQISAVFGLDKQPRSDLTPIKLTQLHATSIPLDFDYLIFEIENCPNENPKPFTVKCEFCTLGKSCTSPSCDGQPCDAIELNDSVHVMGFPANDRVQLNTRFGGVFGLHAFDGRLTYTADTKEGMSGSPVFTDQFDLIAMHHHGQRNVTSHGITIQSVCRDLEARELRQLLKCI